MTDTPTDAPTSTPSAALATLADDERYMAQIPILARQFSRSEMCPEVWRSETVPAQASPEAQAMVREKNERKVADLAIIGQSLAELDIRFSLNTIPQVYIVKGRPGYMAQLQILLAARHGVPVVPLDEESDATKASVKIVGKDKQWHKVTVTMEEAKTAKWPERNPNYRTMPDRMLMARAVTKAIDRHAPEVKMLLPPADREEPFLDMGDEPFPEAAAVFETGEMIGIGSAKNLVLERVKAGGALDDEQAKRMTKLLWDSHGLPNGQGEVLRSRIDQLLASITTERATDDDEPVDAEVVDESESQSPPPARARQPEPEPESEPAEVVDEGQPEMWPEGEEPF